MLITASLDNAAMIGWASMDRFLTEDTDSYDIEPLANWSIEDLGQPPKP